MATIFYSLFLAWSILFAWLIQRAIVRRFPGVHEVTDAHEIRHWKENHDAVFDI